MFEYMHETFHSVRLLGYTETCFRFWMLKNYIFYHMIRTLEVSDDDTVEFVKSIEWSLNSTDSVPLHCL
jgi:hypothetical protein